MKWMFLSVYEFGTLYVGSSSSDCDVLSNFINRLFTEAPSAVIPKIYWKLAPSELHIIYLLLTCGRLLLLQAGKSSQLSTQNMGIAHMGTPDLYKGHGP